MFCHPYWVQPCSGMERHTIVTSRPHHNHHNHHKSVFLRSHARVNFRESLWQSTPWMLTALGLPSAKRRRERRLRAMLRHERQTVAMELAAALHHSLMQGLGRTLACGHRRQRAQGSGPAS